MSEPTSEPQTCIEAARSHQELIDAGAPRWQFSMTSPDGRVFDGEIVGEELHSEQDVREHIEKRLGDFKLIVASRINPPADTEPEESTHQHEHAAS